MRQAGRRRTRIEDATELAFDRSQPFAEFLDGMGNEKAFAPSGGGAGKSVPYRRRSKMAGGARLCQLACASGRALRFGSNRTISTGGDDD